MKLWEKNYVLTMALILFVLYGSVFFILYQSFRMNLEKGCERGVQTEQSVLYSVNSMLNEDSEHRKLKLYCEIMERENVYFAVYEGEDELVNSLPILPLGGIKPGLQIVKDGKNRYLCILDSFVSWNEKEMSLYYIESINEIYKNQQKQVCLFLSINALISIFIAWILYFAMKKIYYPINNIAHELRTPLTSIQGYAQYILFGKVSEKDIQYASSRINEEAGYINEIIERLLVMENIKNGKILVERIDMEELLETVKSHYPNIIIENRMEYIMGDRTLFLCLLMNLLSNTGRSGGQITITAVDNKITIFNPDDYMDADMQKILNGNHSIPKDKIKGKGLGVSLCHEIVKLHHGKLIYEAGKQGVRIVITL